MSSMASQITSLTIVYSTVYAGADQTKHQSSASLAFVRGNHRWPVNSPHKGPVTRKMFPFDDVIVYMLIVNKFQAWMKIISIMLDCPTDKLNYCPLSVITHLRHSTQNLYFDMAAIILHGKIRDSDVLVKIANFYLPMFFQSYPYSLLLPHWSFGVPKLWHWKLMMVKIFFKV